MLERDEEIGRWREEEGILMEVESFREAHEGTGQEKKVISFQFYANLASIHHYKSCSYLLTIYSFLHTFLFFTINFLLELIETLY